MTDIFEHYGLSHLSASQINLYTSEPALWVLRYLFGHKDPLSPAAARGISTEKGIEHGLCNPDAPLQECIDLALQDYDRSLTLIVDDKKEKERRHPRHSRGRPRRVAQVRHPHTARG